MRNVWKTAAGVLTLALGLLLAGPAWAEISYNYVGLDYVNVDVDISETIVEPGFDATVSTDSDYGFRVVGSWQFYENWHVFGDYLNTENDINFSGTFDDMELSVSGKFDVTRGRVGVGYGHPVNQDVSVYGRLSYDFIEFGDISVAEIEDVESTDDSGIGAEGGVRWAVTEPVEIQGYVRYTSVGELDVEVDNKFDDDYLFGAALRYNLNESVGVQAGYEGGQISTWGLSARFNY